MKALSDSISKHSVGMSSRFSYLMKAVLIFCIGIILLTEDGMAQTQLPSPRITLLHDSGRSATRSFNIVVLAEGFREIDMPVFREAAEKTRDGFLSLSPFSELKNKINIWMIETESVDQYIDLPSSVATLYSNRMGNPTLTPRTVDTYFNATWAGDGSSQKDVQFPDWSYDRMCSLVEDLIGRSPLVVELLVILNLPESDGFMQRWSSYPLWSPPRLIDDTFWYHEMGHHFGLNDEDYPFDNCSPGLNHTTNTDLYEGSHPYHHLFTPYSVVATIVDWETWDWDFDTWDLSIVNGNSVISPGLFQTYPPQEGFGDPHGPLHYRPAYSCMMQHTSSGVRLCAYCAEHFRRTIYERMGWGFDREHFYNDIKKVILEIPLEESTAGVSIQANGHLVSSDSSIQIFPKDMYYIKNVMKVDLSDYFRSKKFVQVVIHGSGRISLGELFAHNQNGAHLFISPITELSTAVPERNDIYGKVWWDLFDDGDLELVITGYEPPEAVSTPRTPSGTDRGILGISYSFTTGGSFCFSGKRPRSDPIQYLISWGDGKDSGWLPVGTTSAKKTWSSSGTYLVKARARCYKHTFAVSGWSTPLIVTISSLGERITKPSIPVGTKIGMTGISYSFSTGDAFSDLKHLLEFQFDWDSNGTDLSPWGLSTQWKTWTVPGTYQVTARARCSIDTQVISEWSDPLTIVISEPKGPDLTGSWAKELSQTCIQTKEGQECTLKGTLAVKNIGNEEAASTQVDFYLSGNDMVNQEATLLNSFSTEKLEAGASDAIQFSYKVPVGASLKGQYIVAIIDQEDLIQEIDEKNNIVVAGPL